MQTVHVVHQIPAVTMATIGGQPAAIVKPEPQENGGGDHKEIKGETWFMWFLQHGCVRALGLTKVSVCVVKAESVPSITASSISGVSRIIQTSQAAPLTTVTIMQQASLGHHQLPVKAITQNGTHLVPISSVASTGETQRTQTPTRWRTFVNPVYCLLNWLVETKLRHECVIVGSDSKSIPCKSEMSWNWCKTSI